MVEYWSLRAGCQQMALSFRRERRATFGEVTSGRKRQATAERGEAKAQSEIVARRMEEDEKGLVFAG
jgi:hypothetical protein